MRKIEGGVRELARSIGDKRSAVGDRFGLGDIAVGTVGYLEVRFPEFEWRSRYPNLARYADTLGERPSFRSTIPYPQTIRDEDV
jgi:glutathione S-transferase